jgi:hypothetical protein
MKSLFITIRLALLCTFLGLSSWSIVTAAEPKAAGDFRLDKKEDGVEVYLGDQMVTKYWHKSGTKPILWPIVGPEGLKRTRAYPMDDKQPGEERDHIHHRSLWFTHGEVNGVDFWAETDKSGLIEHRSFGKVEGGKSAVIETTSDWVTRDGKTLLNEERTMTFGHDESARWIDFDITLTSGKEDVHFGDTKEGSFGVRVAESMKVDAKGQPGGTIINSQGQTNGEAWGKPASWVDYHGKVEGKHVGVAMLVRPDSLRYPGRWHVRTYGLFAANPFGEHHFTGSAEKTGGYLLPAGKQLELHYRVVFHPGDEKEGKIQQRWEEYSKTAKAKQ